MLYKSLFIDFAIIKVRTNPEAPTRQPATINAVLDSTIPAKAAAMPDKELSNEITTGISPPPMGRTKTKPAKTETTRKMKKLNSKLGWKERLIPKD